MAARLPQDVVVLTRDGFVKREVDYWSGATPIGYVFSFGVIMGLVVGGIIVYQILFADVSEHLREYATLEGDRLHRPVSVRRRAPGGAAARHRSASVRDCWRALLLYRAAGGATHLPLEMSLPLALGVLGLTAAMCAVAGTIALRKVRQADPAEIF